LPSRRSGLTSGRSGFRRGRSSFRHRRGWEGMARDHLLARAVAESNAGSPPRRMLVGAGKKQGQFGPFHVPCCR
jgi:hypothetical protein